VIAGLACSAFVGFSAGTLVAACSDDARHSTPPAKTASIPEP
jgi:hypothetical protein